MSARRLPQGASHAADSSPFLLRTMRISVKLTVGVIAIATLLAVVGFLGSLTNIAIQANVEHLSQNSLIEVVDAGDMAIALQRSHDALHDLISEKRHASRDDVRPSGSLSQGARDSVQKSLDTLQRTLQHARDACQSSTDAARREGERSLADSLEAKLAGYQRLQDAIVAHRSLVRQCVRLIDLDVAKGEKFLESKLDAHFKDVLHPLIDGQKRAAESEFTGDIIGVKRALAGASARNTTATLFALVFALLLGLYLSHSIGKPLEQLKSAALKIGEGHLDTRVENTSRDEIGVLAATFNRMAEDLQATTVSKTYVDNILESMSEILIVVDRELRIQMINRAGLEQLGFKADELIGRGLGDLLDAPRPRETPSASPGDLLGTGEHRMTTKSGARIAVHWSAAELRGVGGDRLGVVCAALNIDQRKLDEERLRASLAEKEVLLKEVHHRVKNNLQIISSLLALQASEASDADTRRLFEESQGRIRSMALIHEQLYQSNELSRIDFSEYVRRLCENLRESSGAFIGQVSLSLDVDSAPLPLNLAIPCGMILNELISNAIKHAFPSGQRGEIQVAFHFEGSQYVLSVSDNGAGMPATTSQTSLGLKVVQALARQLGGELRVDNRLGAGFTIVFPDPLPDGVLAANQTSIRSSHKTAGDRPHFAESSDFGELSRAE